MKRPTLGLALVLLTLSPGAAQDKTEVSSPFTEEERTLLAPLMRWSFDGRPRFGTDTWREGYLHKLERRPRGSSPQTWSKLPGGARELVALVLELGPFSDIFLDLKNGARLKAENGRLGIVASLGPGRAEVVLSRKRKLWSRAKVSRAPGRFELRVTEGDDRRCLIIEKGRARYTEEIGGEARRGWEAGSFLELYLDHKAAFEGEIFPAFARYGVPRPLFPWHPKPLAVLVRALLPPTLAERDRAFEVLAALEADELAVRERASRRLVEGYTAHRAAILDRLRSPGLSPEARFRLRLIQDRFGGGAEHQVERARDGGLLSDRLFCDLLIEAAPKHRRRDLSRALERLR